MSGAGRGTPRVSPLTEAPPTPGGGSGGGSSVTPLPDGKYSQALSFGDDPTTLTANYQQLQGGATLVEGLTRVSVGLRYRSAGAGGAFQVRVKHILNFPDTIAYQGLPESASPTGDENIIIVRQQVFTHDPVAAGEILNVNFELHMSPGDARLNSTLNLEAKEVGNPGSPGTLAWLGMVGDNLLPALLPAVTAVG